jgi:type I restriction enzyme R subunit
MKDPIEVYYDNQIGIIEVDTGEITKKKKKPTVIADSGRPDYGHKFDILAIIEARNENEAKTGALIQDFESKVTDFFDYIRGASEGIRLIVKMRSHVSEDEVYGDFAIIYRRYRAFNRDKVGVSFHGMRG